MGIEPTLRAWEAPVLPLNYTRKEFNADYVIIWIKKPIGRLYV